MKLAFLSLLALGAGTSLPVVAEEPTKSLDWLVGCWETAGGKTRETWHRGADTLLFGYSVTFRDSEAVFFEQLRLQNVDGDWALFASPRGREATGFDAASVTGGAATFTNSAHDFPQKITYVRTGSELRATASLISGENAQEWRYASCEETP